MRTVPISAKAYDEALAFCNERRIEFGLPGDLTVLPAGRGWDTRSCPCANTCNGRISVKNRQWFKLLEIINPMTGLQQIDIAHPNYKGPWDFGTRI